MPAKISKRVVLSGYALFATIWYASLYYIFPYEFFADHWFIAPTMMVGSFIAGATAEGGGAVAFPVLTLFFKISPAVARDYSLMIQSAGMTSAAATILYMRASISWSALIFAGICGVPGIIFGIEVLSGVMPPAIIKLFFVSWWTGFALALYLINEKGERGAIDDVAFSTWTSKICLVVAALIGGSITGISGSGLDIVVFSALVLMMGLREDVATRTSVVLMAWGSLVGFSYKGFSSGMATQAWNFWLIAVPVAIFFAPFGAWFMKTKSRDFVRRVLYAIIVLQFITAFFVIPLSRGNLWFSAGTIVASIAFFYGLERLGRRAP